MVFPFGEIHPSRAWLDRSDSLSLPDNTIIFKDSPPRPQRTGLRRVALSLSQG